MSENKNKISTVMEVGRPSWSGTQTLHFSLPVEPDWLADFVSVLRAAGYIVNGKRTITHEEPL